MDSLGYFRFHISDSSISFLLRQQLQSHAEDSILRITIVFPTFDYFGQSSMDEDADQHVYYIHHDHRTNNWSVGCVSR